MCIPYEQAAVFKKRVSGYLVEFNLQKKRYADAYYYYGITRKEYPTINLTDLEKQRDIDRKGFFFKDTFCTSDLLPTTSLA